MNHHLYSAWHPCKKFFQRVHHRITYRPCSCGDCHSNEDNWIWHEPSTETVRIGGKTITTKIKGYRSMKHPLFVNCKHDMSEWLKNMLSTSTIGMISPLTKKQLRTRMDSLTMIHSRH